MNFGGSSDTEEEDHIENELDEPPKKHPRSTKTMHTTQKEGSTSETGNTIDQQLALLLEEVKKTNSELSGVSPRLQSVEKRMEVIEEDGVVSSSSADSTKKKRKITNKVRVRMIYSQTICAN